ncbi:MAG: hypothetical protein AB7H97_22620 [Pseudobdellovibrionaceae bacterium]
MENLSSLQNVCFHVFEVVSKTTSIFVLPAFVAQVAFSNVLGEGVKSLDLLKRTTVYFLLIAGFPLFLQVLFAIPESFLPKYDSMNDFLEGAGDAGIAGIIPFALDRILEVILAGLYWIVYYLHIFIMLLLCSMAPIVFLSSTLLGMGLGLDVFLGLMIAVSSWPIIWFGFDVVHERLAFGQNDAFGAKCLELIVTLMKGLGPVGFAILTVKGPVGKAASKLAKAALGAGKMSVLQVATVGNASPDRHSQGYYTNRQNREFQRMHKEASFQDRRFGFDRDSRKELKPKEKPRKQDSQSGGKARENPRERNS